MANHTYRLQYLPLFYDDLEETITYIAETLQNPHAANDLLDAVESAILKRVDAAEGFEPYHSLKERRYPYYRIYVNNYVIYYVVITDEGKDRIMEVSACGGNHCGEHQPVTDRDSGSTGGSRDKECEPECE